jgi:hypothetical protein
MLAMTTYEACAIYIAYLSGAGNTVNTVVTCGDKVMLFSPIVTMNYCVIELPTAIC